MTFRGGGGEGGNANEKAIQCCRCTVFASTHNMHDMQEEGGGPSFCMAEGSFKAKRSVILEKIVRKILGENAKIKEAL